MRSRALLLFVLLAACLALPPAPAALPAVLTRRAPKKAKPEVPGWGFYPRVPGVWLRYHTHLAAGRGRDSLVFFGDSLTFEWPDKDRAGPTGGAATFPSASAITGSAATPPGRLCGASSRASWTACTHALWF